MSTKPVSLHQKKLLVQCIDYVVLMKRDILLYHLYKSHHQENGASIFMKSF